MSEKIGIGILTLQPRQSFFDCFDSVYRNKFISEGIIINDGKPGGYHNIRWPIIQTGINRGVGVCKNRALIHLLDQGCDHIFLIEDDIYVKDPTVFQRYIEASKITGIQHFNFSQHGMMNKSWPGGIPNPVNIIDYGSVKIALHRHCVGAFSYYSRKCLETVGLIDEEYYNACEHVDHTYGIVKAGMHPPFWFFADIENSQDYLGDEEWSLTQSTISSNPKHTEIVQNADKIFVKKHGHLPGQTPLTSEEGVIQSLKNIKNTYGKI